ncbi:MAG: type II secretion system protein [Armatimonadetes bacterium]|nr:type II secretion system protein [Armatimonadota bacterium]
MKRQGFTLVELLVVIAVIAILAAMLMPVFLQAKESSRMRVCLSNMRQLGFAISNYIDDNSGLSLPQNSPLSSKNPWVLCIEPLLPSYIPGSKAMLNEQIKNSLDDNCPPQPKRIWICAGDINRGAMEVDQPYWWNLGSSYMYPGPTAYVDTTNTPKHRYDKEGLTPRKPFRWLNYKRDFLIMDYWYDFHSGGRRVGHQMREGDEDPSVLPSACQSFADVKCLNTIFLDLHAKALTPRERELYRRYVINPVEDGGDNPYSNK